MKNKTKNILIIVSFIVAFGLANFNEIHSFQENISAKISDGKEPQTSTTNKPRSSYVVVPLTINVVEGTNLTKAEVEERVKKMNEIYNCEVVIFVWNGTINTVPDPEGNGDGKIDYNATHRTKVRSDAAKKSGGKGVSITVTNSLGDNNTNGMCIVGGAHSAIVRKGTDGTTWAHEVQHALGQSHGQSQPAGEDLDGDGDKTDDRGWDIDGDGNVTKKDQGYNLWGRRSDRTGNNMTTAGHDAIYGNASALPGARVKTRPAKPATTKTDGITPLKGGISPGKRNESLTPEKKSSNIIQGGFSVNYTDPKMTLCLQLADMPAGIVSFNLIIDADPNHGNPLDGADIWIDLFCNMGVFELTPHTWGESDWIDLPPLPFLPSPGMDTINLNNITGSGLVDSFFDVFVEVDIPEPAIVDPLRFSEETKFWFESWSEMDYSDRTANSTVDMRDIPDETITVSNELTTAGGYLTVNGTNFSPESTVTLYFDGESIGTVPTDTQGFFTHDILVIRELSKENVILTAMDAQGKGDGIYIDIEGSGTKTTSSTDTTSSSSTSTQSDDTADVERLIIPGYSLFWTGAISIFSCLFLLRKRSFWIQLK
ncbi:hypothetical protein NEF87_001154 [Candidatus Lokiarchaeum ossiferum]|uniref:IPT/TIG domain-containing protein n=1 Tax=Candidatus Lokiarchaeum ossiferum TaxID=2951803 RepID=A0ABY6HQL3_9ARCH|nr:hypothetical protein NEF87_001154 [Candidatus Lokiarchaeum sp. B-35]